MHESMTLIEQANIFNKTNHQNLYFDRTSFKNKDLKSHSFHVYSSGHLISNPKQTKHYRTDKLILPPIDKDENRYRRKPKRPSYRTSLYHSNSTNFIHTDLSSLAARGTKPELLLTTTIIKDDDTVYNLQRHHAPPPSPSDDHLERLLSEFNRIRQPTPLRSETEVDGYVPYRLPALHQSARRRHTELNFPPKAIQSTLSNYLQTFY